MSPLRRAALAAVVLVALALGLRWHLARGAEALMAELARQTAPFGRLTWRATTAGFDGRLGASGLTFETAGSRLTAERLTFDLGGLPQTLARSWPGARPGLPSTLRLELIGFAMPIPPSDPASPALGLESLDVVPCGGQDGAAVMRAFVGTRLTADLAFGYRFDAADHRLAFDLELAARELAAVRLELELEALEPTAAPEDLIRARPVARRGALAVTERGWYAASARHCAARSGLAADAWLDAHVVGVLELLAVSGLAPSADLIAGYREFRRAPAQARISFDNAALHGAEALLARTPGEIAALVGLAVRFNDVPVADASFDVAGAQRMPAAAPLADAPAPGGAESLLEEAVRPLVSPVPASAPAEAAREPTRRRAPGKAPAYSPPPGSTALTPSSRPPAGGTVLRWDALRNARGTAVAVVMKDGRTLRGAIRDATPWQLSLEQRIKGGSAVLPIDRDAVARVVAEP